MSTQKNFNYLSLSHDHLLQQFCKQTNSWCVEVNIKKEDLSSFLQSDLFLSLKKELDSDTLFKILQNDIFLFDDQKEARKFYAILNSEILHNSVLHARMISPVIGFVCKNDKLED